MVCFKDAVAFKEININISYKIKNHFYDSYLKKIIKKTYLFEFGC